MFNLRNCNVRQCKVNGRSLKICIKNHLASVWPQKESYGEGQSYGTVTTYMHSNKSNWEEVSVVLIIYLPTFWESMARFLSGIPKSIPWYLKPSQDFLRLRKVLKMLRTFLVPSPTCVSPNKTLYSQSSRKWTTLLMAPSSKPCFNSPTNTVISHSHKRTFQWAPMDTFRGYDLGFSFVFKLP